MIWAMSTGIWSRRELPGTLRSILALLGFAVFVIPPVLASASMIDIVGPSVKGSAPDLATSPPIYTSSAFGTEMMSLGLISMSSSGVLASISGLS